jgi:aminoglycoside phosphotransferase (APT) family kinase protein
MELIARGRDCDVFALDDRSVLRRQRDGRSLEHEATVMQHVRREGFPCPEVFDVVGPDMVMERVLGGTLTVSLLESLTEERMRSGAKLLGDLHRRLHLLAPMPGCEGAILHLDLHPDNVLMVGDEPIVIDWTNAGHGHPDVDVAMTWLILEPFARLDPAVRSFADAFLVAVGREAALVGLPEAAARRLRDPNVTLEEAAVIRDLCVGLST